jgi:large subunit ribosomal protein L22
MSKKSAPRRVGETEARAFSRSIRVSPRKLNLMAQLIRGKSAEADSLIGHLP